MPNKIRITFLIVAVVAVFSVYKLAQYVHVVANRTPSFQGSSPLPNPDEDPDHDGLDNMQEVIWGSDPFISDSDGDGFKDGEEVKSGHNPLVPGPNDLINQDNLTQQFSELTVSGIYSGDLKPESPNYSKAVSDITNAISDSGKYLFTQQSNATSFNTTDNGTQNEIRYIKTISPIIDDLGSSLADQYRNLIPKLNVVGEKGFGDASVKSYFSTQASIVDGLMQQVKNVPVPTGFVNNHDYLFSLLQQIHNIDDAIAGGDNDPVKASAAFGALGDIYQNYFRLTEDYENTIKAKNITVD